MKAHTVRVGSMAIGTGHPLVLIAGPCVLESEKSAFFHAAYLKKLTDRLGIPFIFKASYDKANRTSVASYRGPGLRAGLRILRAVKKEFSVPVLSDVHSVEEAKAAAAVIDVLQIPAFLCRQTDLILAAARTRRVINVKKGQFLAPWDMLHVVRKIESTGNRKILLTDRGVSFGYNTLVSDLRSPVIMKKTGYPVVYDATHSVQSPGGRGQTSGGDREFVPYLSCAAVCCGVDALFLEVHRQPARALSDGANMIPLAQLAPLLCRIRRLSEAMKGPL